MENLIFICATMKSIYKFTRDTKQFANRQEYQEQLWHTFYTRLLVVMNFYFMIIAFSLAIVVLFSLDATNTQNLIVNFYLVF